MMVVKFVYHKECDEEVIGVVVRTFKYGVDIDCEVINMNDIGNDPRPTMVILVAKTFEDVYEMAIHNNIITCPYIKYRYGIVINDIAKPLTEMIAFKIFTLSSVNHIINEINKVLNAT